MSESMFGNPETGQPAEQPQVNQEPAPQAPQTNEPNLFADQLAGIKADDGRQKYADVKTALESIPHAQEHIKSLNEKVQALEAELQQKAGMEQVLERINEASHQKAPEPPANQGLDETNTARVVETLLEQREQTKRGDENQATVVTALREKFGEKAEEVYLKKAQELGIPETELVALARKSPAAVLAYFPEAAPAPNPQPISNGFQAPPAPQEAPENNWMSRFKGGESDLVNKWRSAKPTE